MSRYLITSALPYINGVKHLGNLVGSMLPADVYARYLRQRGDEVLYICATDEHGTPAELAARAAGMGVAEFCTQAHEVQRDLSDRFDLSFDHFGRTSHPFNHETTRYFADRLDAAGYIEERTTSQVFSLDDERFLPDRYVEGTCPNCGYERARGDQCEHCTKQLEPVDLINPRSAISGSERLEVRDSVHLFLLQSRLADDLSAWVDSKVGDWPVLATSIAKKWLDEGLQDRGITRDLSWGVAVDRPGFEGKVYYVWFDAPIGYISATKEWAALDEGRSWERWWRTDEGADDVIYTQFMAKDNIPFHTLGFPATILGSQEPWKLVDQLKGFNWLNYYGGKFSTSEGRGVFMSDALELLPADYWRWYLMSNAPESDDASFSWELFAESTNKELVGTLGNFVNRCATQVNKHFDGLVPDGGAVGEPETNLVAELRTLIGDYLAAMDALEYRKSTAALRAIWAAGNSYLEIREPWRAIKVDRDDAAIALRTGLGLARLYGHLSSPFIPSSAERITATLPDAAPLVGLSVDLADSVLELEPGTSFVAPELLFRKLTPEDLDAWRGRFGGGE